NLITNAIKYTEKNGKIRINAYKENEFIKISVEDNGIGIPKEDLNYIFERFYRVDKSRNKETGGIGVGLTIVKAIVNEHGGEIDVISEAKVGTKFIIILPKE
ncbi:MAG: sensor histidine kinase, partial [Peptostreptococcaceae bacterium]